MAKEEIEIEEFIELAESGQWTVLDIRSPREYQKGHFPGAENFPLFSDEERAEVGITYKKKGREKAILKGLQIVGPKLEQMAAQLLEFDPPKLLLYCWRGGMRSYAVGWLASLLGREVRRLRGGYKKFRQFVLETFEQKKQIVLLGGFTGSGKTEILKILRERGEQVLDLEGLASHRGSAFGNIGLPPQPPQQLFENRIALLWRKFEPNRPVWIENESRTIGHVAVPDSLWKQMLRAPIISLEMPAPLRVQRLLEDYGHFPKEELIDAIRHIQRRLGPQHAETAIRLLDENKLDECTLLLLRQYYDKTYLYGLQKREPPVYTIPTDTADPVQNAEKILQELKKISKEISEYYEIIDKKN